MALRTSADSMLALVRRLSGLSVDEPNKGLLKIVKNDNTSLHFEF